MLDFQLNCGILFVVKLEKVVETKTKQRREVMSKKNKNPYRDESAYNVIFGAWQKLQVTTKQALVEMGFSSHDITVVLSPRESSKRGNCLGNFSAQGHVYFADKLNRKVVDGVKEDQKFRLRWRKEVLEPRKRPVKGDKVEAKKVIETKVTETTTTKAKSKTKAKA